MFSDDLPPYQPVPIGNPGPVPVPESIERAEMRSVLRRHISNGGNCRSCRQPPDHTGMCWVARVAYERLVNTR
ncbi:hypothetical protein [Micromonospora sp. HM5-17]|uniref:hypothetical protein n=1 Tax=Micromonospora sp. HM5-17 TaxID=2487710 RepID=UPI000F4ADB17|nr:hypothetical protein [Micromonospora sp. HM5-17]ROT25447.1 hypothetical protein EF879_26850 [Micromonospora sp. HM5-17]